MVLKISDPHPHPERIYWNYSSYTSILGSCQKQSGILVGWCPRHTIKWKSMVNTFGTVSSHVRISIGKYLEEHHQTGNSSFKESKNTFGEGFTFYTLYFYNFWIFKITRTFNLNNQKKTKTKQHSSNTKRNSLLEAHHKSS